MVLLGINPCFVQPYENSARRLTRTSAFEEAWAQQKKAPEALLKVARWPALLRHVWLSWLMLCLLLAFWALRVRRQSVVAESIQPFRMASKAFSNCVVLSSYSCHRTRVGYGHPSARGTRGCGVFPTTVFLFLCFGMLRIWLQFYRIAA